MKTKNILVVAALVISGILNVYGLFAQTPSNTDDVKLNIVLNPIQTIVVDAATDHQTVDLVYSTIKDYAEGVSVTRNNHLQVFSTGGFQVQVKSGQLSNGTVEIDASDVTVLATKGEGNKVENSVTAAVALGGEKTLISSVTGGRDLKYNVTYNNELGKNDKYLNLYKNGGNNTFTTTVTYTIAAL